VAGSEGGGTKIMRGLLIATALVAALVLIVVFWRQILDALGSGLDYLTSRFPDQSGQQMVVIIYLVLAVIFGILFSKAGHFTAFGVAIALLPLLWFLFWEGFPLLGLDPNWKSGMGIDHMGPQQVILWAVVGAVVITLVFVPLELWEKYRRRRRALGAD
jgi:undecaprenyl pyrophosphate phosphatase UppP